MIRPWRVLPFANRFVHLNGGVGKQLVQFLIGVIASLSILYILVNKYLSY